MITREENRDLCLHLFMAMDANKPHAATGRKGKDWQLFYERSFNHCDGVCSGYKGWPGNKKAHRKFKSILISAIKYYCDLHSKKLATSGTPSLQETIAKTLQEEIDEATADYEHSRSNKRTINDAHRRKNDLAEQCQSMYSNGRGASAPSLSFDMDNAQTNGLHLLGRNPVSINCKYVIYLCIKNCVYF